MPTDFEDYLKRVQLQRLLKALGADNPAALAKTLQHFTTKEAEKRDEIVVNYFGKCNTTNIVRSITDSLSSQPKLPPKAKVLDVGAGSGFFTVRIADKVRSKLPNADFYAMDLTPAMLLSLSKKKAKITSFLGLAENIKGSIEQARKIFRIPLKYDAVFSTLMLHHSTFPAKVFESISSVLKKTGKAVIVDMCEHRFEEFRAEMGDLHLGFRLADVSEMARQHFSTVKIGKMPGIHCTSSGRSAEIFIAVMKTPLQGVVK